MSKGQKKNYEQSVRTRTYDAVYGGGRGHIRTPIQRMEEYFNYKEQKKKAAAAAKVRGKRKPMPEPMPNYLETKNKPKRA